MHEHFGHLHNLSQYELNARIAEYDFPDPYKTIYQLGIEIRNFCDNYEPRLRHDRCIFAIKSRIYYYTNNKSQEHSVITTKLKEELARVKNIHIETVLPRELNGRMIDCIQNIYKINRLENIDTRFNIDRQKLLCEERDQRNRLFTTGYCIDQCINFLNRETASTEHYLGASVEDIAKAAYTIKIKRNPCWRCEGKINFEDTYTMKDDTLIYFTVKYFSNGNILLVAGITLKGLAAGLNTNECSCFQCANCIVSRKN